MHKKFINIVLNFCIAKSIIYYTFVVHIGF